MLGVVLRLVVLGLVVLRLVVLGFVVLSVRLGRLGDRGRRRLNSLSLGLNLSLSQVVLGVLWLVQRLGGLEINTNDGLGDSCLGSHGHWSRRNFHRRGDAFIIVIVITVFGHSHSLGLVLTLARLVVLRRVMSNS